MGFIQFDFQKAYQQQLELDSIAAELNQLAERDMTEVLNQLQSAWSGENADAYLAKGILLQDVYKRQGLNGRCKTKRRRTLHYGIFFF